MDRREFVMSTGVILTALISGCSEGSSTDSTPTSTDSTPTQDTPEDGSEEDQLKELFNSAAENQEGYLQILNIQLEESAIFADFVPSMDTMDERAEKMGDLIGVYAGVVDSGEDLPGMIGFAYDEIGGEEVWSFECQRECVDEWLAGEIDGNEVVQRAADTYEEYDSVA